MTGGGLKQRVTHTVKFKNRDGKGWWMGKAIGDFKRKLVKLIYGVMDSWEPLYLMQIEKILF